MAREQLADALRRGAASHGRLGPASSWPGPGPWSRQRDPKALNQQVIVGPGLECGLPGSGRSGNPRLCIEVVSFPFACKWNVPELVRRIGADADTACSCV